MIRSAKISDSQTIVEFQKLMALETEGLKLDTDILIKGVLAVFNDPTKGQYFVFEKENTVVASLLITYEWSDWRNGNVWWIQSVFVVKSHRNQGIFRLMYEYLKNVVINSDIRGLRLYVDKSNKNAQQVYSNLGMNGEHYQVFEWMK